MPSRFAPILVLLLSACAAVPPPAPTPAAAPSASAPVVAAPSCPSPAACPACPVCPDTAKPEPPPPAAPFRAATWSELPGWERDELAQAWPALLASCRAFRDAAVRAAWAPVCEAARAMGDAPATANVRAFLESNVQPWQLVNTDGSVEGLVTGYYEPLIRASRWKSARFPVPVHAVPDDMLNLDLAEVYPDTRNMRLRGRLDGRKVVPYWSRAQIAAQGERFPSKVLVWAEDAVEVFFLQVQGSGQAQLSDGSRVRLAYADQNGHPYVSIGRWLVQNNELRLEQASMQGISAWARANPQRLNELLNVNPSYVFFREEPAGNEGPKGSLGVPLTAGRSIAVDPRSVPLGVPVFMALPMPDGAQTQRLMLAQDTGGAIRGRVRADWFWGFGAEAGAQAGRMRQQGRMWVLWPNGATPPAMQ